MIGAGPSAFLGGAQPINGLQHAWRHRDGQGLRQILEYQPKMRMFAKMNFVCVTSKGRTTDLVRTTIFFLLFLVLEEDMIVTDKFFLVGWGFCQWYEMVRTILCAMGASKIWGVEPNQLEAGEIKVHKEGDGEQQQWYVLVEDGASLSWPSVMGYETTMRTGEEGGHKRRKLTKVPSFGRSGVGMMNPNEKVFERIVDFEWVKQCLIYGQILPPQLWAGEAPQLKVK